MKSLYCHFISIYSSNGGNLGDVNISALLTSFQTGYDKRVRPNYGGKKYMFELLFLIILMEFLSLTKYNDVHTINIHDLLTKR